MWPPRRNKRKKEKREKYSLLLCFSLRPTEPPFLSHSFGNLLITDRGREGGWGDGAAEDAPCNKNATISMFKQCQKTRGGRTRGPRPGQLFRGAVVNTARSQVGASCKVGQRSGAATTLEDPAPQTRCRGDGRAHGQSTTGHDKHWPSDTLSLVPSLVPRSALEEGGNGGNGRVGSRRAPASARSLHCPEGPGRAGP